MDKNQKIKLHLGCQEKYLEGYINIDLPPAEHTAQIVKADIYADVRTLTYEKESIDGVRSHHLLEHFSRQEALILLSRWHSWLKMDGLLVIETPDFEESAKKFIKGGMDEKFVLGRHIFGSHEASWAYHKDFWCEEKFRYVLERLGFRNFRFEKFSNNLEQKIPQLKGGIIVKQERILKSHMLYFSKVLPNIALDKDISKMILDYKKMIKNILEQSLVGRETKILDVWMDEVNQSL